MSLDVDRFLRLGRVSALAPSPCGRFLAVSRARLDAAGARLVSDLWRVSLDQADAAPVQLTRGDHDDRAPHYRADGALLFLSTRPTATDPSPDGRAQVWLLPASGGEPWPLTDEALGVSDLRVGHDALVVLADVEAGVPATEQRAAAIERAALGPSALTYRTTPVRHWDHWVGSASPHLIAFASDGSARRDLSPEADGVYRNPELEAEWSLSADGRRVAITALSRGADRIPDVALHVFDVVTGERRVVGSEARTSHGHPVLSADGRWLVASRHRRVDGQCGRPGLWRYDLDGRGDGQAVAADWDVWPHPHLVDDDGTIIATAEVAGQVPVFRVSPAGQVQRLTSASAGGSHGQLARVGDHLVGVRSTMLAPPRPFRLALGADASGETEALADLAGFTDGDGAAMAEVESLSSPADDGQPVEWFWLRPPGPVTRRPTLVWIHGGPISHHADGWHWRWNPLLAVAAGYNVALPNPRGSLGFGQDFVEGIWNNQWGAACYRDLMAVCDQIAARADVDPQRVAAMGGSFGGYMTNWIGGATDRFRCLVSHAGLFDLGAFHGTTDYPAYMTWEMAAPPWRDVDAFDRYSPHRQVAAWRSPTLLLHGERDYRVPIGEALAMFEALDAHGVEVELVVFPDENHWIQKPRNVRAWHDAVYRFLAQHMC